MSSRTQGWTSRHPSFHLSFHLSPPHWPLGPQISTVRLDFRAFWGLQAIKWNGFVSPSFKTLLKWLLQEGSHRGPLSPQINPSRLQFSPYALKSAFQTSNRGLKSALSMPPWPQICSSGQKSALQTFAFNNLNHSSQAWYIPPQDVRKFTPVSYRTSALWGRCPALTPLLHLITASRATGTADHVRSLDD